MFSLLKFCFLSFAAAYASGAWMLDGAIVDTLNVGALNVLNIFIGLSRSVMFPAAVFLFIVNWKLFWERRYALLCTIASCMILIVSFGILKHMVPHLNPYYADPALARFDNWLLGGRDAWEIVYAYLPPIFTKYADFIYLGLWTVPAIAFPILIIVVDKNVQRVMTYIWVYFSAWWVAGLAVATLGSSTGPVFYDRLLGGDRFAGLTEALRSSGMAQTRIGITQDALWQIYGTKELVPGFAISAFPSMHVAVASIAAFYLAERGKIGGVVGMSFLALILILSISTGYHYVSDGGASIAIVALLRLFIGRYFSSCDPQSLTLAPFSRLGARIFRKPAR
jgi:hypothetical protein